MRVGGQWWREKERDSVFLSSGDVEVSLMENVHRLWGGVNWTGNSESCMVLKEII